MKRRLYFTNQTADRHYARMQEQRIEKSTGLILENPFYDGNAKEVKQLDAGKPTKLSEDEIVGMDLRKIRDSDGIVALFTNVSNIGSAMEVAICAYAWGKPVYIVAEYDGAYLHPWIKYFANKLFRTVDEFINYWNTERT